MGENAFHIVFQEIGFLPLVTKKAPSLLLPANKLNPLPPSLINRIKTYRFGLSIDIGHDGVIDHMQEEQLGQNMPMF